MPVLPDAWSLIMNVLLNAPVAWQSPAEIAAVLGRGQEETTDLLCDLDVAGWVVVWEVKSGPLVTLSALAAERLSARLVAVGPEETPRWALAGDPEPPSPRAKNVCLSERAASLEFKTDPAMSPDMTAEWAEHAEAMALNRQGQWTTRPGNRVEPPRPTVLLGLSQTPWPGPAISSDSVCPVCGDRTLGPQMYCLYCDRWGLDFLVPASHAPAAVTSRATRPETERTLAESQQSDRLRARRKARRRRRQQVKLEASRMGKPVSQNKQPPSNRPMHGA